MCTSHCGGHYGLRRCNINLHYRRFSFKPKLESFALKTATHFLSDPGPKLNYDGNYIHSIVNCELCFNN